MNARSIFRVKSAQQATTNNGRHPEEHHPLGDPFPKFVPAAAAQRLITAVGQIGDSHAELAERRRAILGTIAELVQASSGFWAWGRGKPLTTAVAPIAIIDFGFTKEQRTTVIEWGLEERTDRE